MPQSPKFPIATIGAVLLLCVSLDVHAQDGAAARVQQIVAHRGSSVDRPENTLASIRGAIEVGATAVEVDVRMTQDGVAVLSHDSRVDRTTNGRGMVGDKTLAEIQRLDAGSWFDPRFAGERIPTLAQVLALCRDRVDVLLDLKESGGHYEREVIALVKSDADPARIIVGVRSVEQARRIRELLPQARQIGLIGWPGEIEAYASAGVDLIRLWPSWMRLWPSWLTGTTLAGRVRKAGVKLHLNGTTGGPDEVAELLEHRPDSLLSDDPARLIATLAELAELAK